MTTTNDPAYTKETVSRWFEEDKELLSDVHFGQEIILIIATLRERKESIGRYIVVESGLTKAAVYRKIRRLLEDGLITQDTGAVYNDRKTGKRVRDGRVTTYYLTEKGRKVAEYLKAYPLPRPRSPTRRFPAFSRPSTDARAFHSERIRELLEKIVDEMPLISSLEICYPSPYPHERTYDGEDLPIENEVLFDDLRNHLKDFDRFHDSYSGFKESCSRFRRLKEEVLEEMRLDISKNFGLGFSPRWERPNSFSSEMVEWTFRAGLYLGSKDRHRHFERYFLDFKSKVEKRTLPDGQKTLEYWVAGEGLIQVARKHAQAEIFRREIDERLRTHMEKLGDAPYYGDIEMARNLMNKAMTFREDLVKVLRKNMEMGTFPGDCEFLDAALGTD